MSLEPTIRHVQARLKFSGFYKDRIDGDAGPNTWRGIKAVVDKHLPEPEVSTPSATKTKFPKQRDMRKFFGRPGGPQCTRGKVHLEVPMVIAWNTSQKISRFSCHEKLAEPLTEIFRETLEHYGEDEWRRLRLDRFGGCYNYRKMRGGRSLSTHAYGAAVDLDPDNNRLRWRRDRASFAKPEYEPFWNIVEAHGFVSLGRAKGYDFMHMQAARI
jgi:hypothetical protein